jgi:hypothetical protein
MIPGISKPPMRGTSVEQPDPFAHGQLPLHLFPALGTLVQLLKAAAFRGFVVAHPEDSWTAACIGSTSRKTVRRKRSPCTGDLGV